MKKKRGDNRLKKVDKGEIGSMKKRKMVNKIFCNKGKRRRVFIRGSIPKSKL